MNIAAASACVLAVLGGGTFYALSRLPKAPAQDAPRVEVAAPALGSLDNRQSAAPVLAPRPTATPAPTATPGVTPEPTATLEPAPELARKAAPDALDAVVFRQTASPGAEYADPAQNNLLSMTQAYEAEGGGYGDEIHMGSSAEYAQVEGVTTFRGSNYRDGGAYGEIPESPTRMSVIWNRPVGSIDTWGGVGWTGQPSIVRWPADLRSGMNLNEDKKQKDGLTEVLYATLDGHIYFMDLEDGADTRPAIGIGAPIKGSLAVDPRGLPLLYCGQGIYEINGKKVACGTRIWSLIDQQQLYFLNGSDPVALRGWFAFDCSPLVDGDTDTMITCGENGVLYKVKLNSREYAGGIAVEPSVVRYVYQQTKGGKLGTENSMAVYNNYAYFATNVGIIQCVDLNTMALVWCYDTGDDLDASLVIEPEADGLVGLYASNELDKRGNSGSCQMLKLNALTGELLWRRDSDPIYQDDENGGGSFATPAVGKGTLSDLVYFHVCRTVESQGMLYALDKRTGETVWTRSMGRYGWSSPTCLYSPSGAGYVLVGSSDGHLWLLDGLTGGEVADVELKGNIEGTPAVFDDTIVVGTRAGYIYGIRICA